MTNDYKLINNERCYRNDYGRYVKSPLDDVLNAEMAPLCQAETHCNLYIHDAIYETIQQWRACKQDIERRYSTLPAYLCEDDQFPNCDLSTVCSALNRIDRIIEHLDAMLRDYQACGDLALHVQDDLQQLNYRLNEEDRDGTT